MMSTNYRIILTSLPVELLYEIQLFSLSESLPCVNKRSHEIFKLATSAFRAQFLIACFENVTNKRSRARGVMTKALRYPLCTIEVMETMFKSPLCPPLDATPELPRRLFKALSSKGQSEWSYRDAPLPFLRHLYNCDRIRPPNPNSHDGYALTMAVYADFIPLIRFLLDNGASPACHNRLAVKVAIRKKDLGITRMLIESEWYDNNGRRGRDYTRPQQDDRIQVTPGLLKIAVQAGAIDIGLYFMEKGVAPDIDTLRLNLPNIIAKRPTGVAQGTQKR
ncbi:hypothetical protein BD410DRAFT_821720 [Rickenella mellea]|uniref:Ankyrin n=1 Tax=Rickenella mellea TaxID=50990 RepID=A0A4Y7Q0C6_9AGAM|nr:hypothetical protein BD410DRAFT_821720 [Rickenella mellea]